MNFKNTFRDAARQLKEFYLYHGANTKLYELQKKKIQHYIPKIKFGGSKYECFK